MSEVPPSRLYPAMSLTHSIHCYDATSGRISKLMGHSQGRTNVKKRAARRKKTERLAAAKKAKKKTAK
jgi:hypothetical protein